jgi:hypothetical protein
MFQTLRHIVFAALLASSLANAGEPDRIQVVRLSESKIALVIDGKTYPISKKLGFYEHLFYRVDSRNQDPVCKVYIWSSSYAPTWTDENGQFYTLTSLRFEMVPDKPDLNVLEGPAIDFWGDCITNKNTITFTMKKPYGMPVLLIPQKMTFQLVPKAKKARS